MDNFRASATRWASGVPVTTRVVAGTLLACFAVQLVAARSWRVMCVSPVFVLRRLQVWRVATSPLWHAGVLHLALNLAAFLPIGTRLERTLGSVRFAHLVAVLAGVQQLIFIALAYTAALVGFRRAIKACVLGFSGVLFALIVADNAASGAPPAYPLGPKGPEIPGPLLPWALLLVIQIVVPRASLLGHLAGILAGEAWAAGLLAWLHLGDPAVAAAEASPVYEARLPRLGPVVGAHYNAAPTWQIARARAADGSGPNASSLAAARDLAERSSAAAWSRVPPPQKERILQAWHAARLAVEARWQQLLSKLPPQVVASASAAFAAAYAALPGDWQRALSAAGRTSSNGGGDEEALPLLRGDAGAGAGVDGAVGSSGGGGAGALAAGAAALSHTSPARRGPRTVAPSADSL